MKRYLLAIFLMPTIYAESWRLLVESSNTVTSGQLVIYEKDNVPYIISSPNYSDLSPYITRPLVVPCMELFYIFDQIETQAFLNTSVGYFQVSTAKADYLLTERALIDAKRLDGFIFVMRHINAPFSVKGNIDAVVDGKPIALAGGFVLPQFNVFGIGEYQHYVSTHSGTLTTANWRDYTIAKPEVTVKGHSVSMAYRITVNNEQVYLLLLHVPPSAKKPTAHLSKGIQIAPSASNPRLKELEAILRGTEDVKPQKK